MSGSYSSEQQHLKDTANYFDIRLQIIPIWKHRTDGFWFYVEQAVFAYYDQPYRQRVDSSKLVCPLTVRFEEVAALKFRSNSSEPKE